MGIFDTEFTEPAFAVLRHLRDGVLGVLDVGGQEGEDVERLLRQGLQNVGSPATAPAAPLPPPLDRLQFGVHPGGQFNHGVTTRKSPRGGEIWCGDSP